MRNEKTVMFIIFPVLRLRMNRIPIIQIGLLLHWFVHVNRNNKSDWINKFDIEAIFTQMRIFISRRLTSSNIYTNKHTLTQEIHRIQVTICTWLMRFFLFQTTHA